MDLADIDICGVRIDATEYMHTFIVQALNYRRSKWIREYILNPCLEYMEAR